MQAVDVVIPTYKPDHKLRSLLQYLAAQTYPVQKVIIMNTEQKYWPTQLEEERYPFSLEVHHISRDEFDHGATRDRGIRYSSAPYVLLMTQDAVPFDNQLVDGLLLGFDNPMIAVTYARQLANPGSAPLEQFTRNFNYPEESRVKKHSDLATLGIKTYFCSNVCAMYRRSVYDELGGFIKKTIFNEDMIFASNVIKAGYEIHYVATARVYHSHDYTALEQFHRNFDLGVSQADHPEVFEEVPSEAEGKKLVKMSAEFLKDEGQSSKILNLYWVSGWKYLGYRMGKAYKKLPKWLIKKCSMNRKYFE
ncbi:MAG: glycosyltransferase family 2 protein [Lachnospiraceae bacterium]|nr:glycosyltransferase family 2 protein [Lachnospiraceae bacterium]